MSSKARSPSSKSTSPGGKKSKVQLNINPIFFKLRIKNEIEYFQQHLVVKAPFVLTSADNDGRRWTLLFQPNKAPYNVGAFKMLLELPPEYPYKPPVVQFITKTYHPNIDENGKIDVQLCLADYWKPSTRVVQICDAIYQVLNCPDASKAVRKNIAEQMVQRRDAFMNEATDFCKKFCEKV